MKHYEYTYLTRPDMAEEEAKKLQDKLAASIQAKNGTITNLPKPYKKRLAYRIKSQVAAYVNTILFEMEPAPLEAFKKETDGIAEIIRGLIISYDPERMKEKPRRERSTSGPVVSAAVEVDVKAKIQTGREPAKDEKQEPKSEETAKENLKEEERKEDETKAAKPRRKLKPKAELRDIEEKLDEILK